MKEDQVAHLRTPPRRLALWGGVECTVNRVRDCYFDQLQRSGHATRPDDLERFASLGITAIRYPVLWEHVAPAGLESADWSWPDERLPALRALGVRPIAGLVHHGSGPQHTHLLDDEFATGLAAYAGAVARRYPWLLDYTPVNEPLTTARFSTLYGAWYPHERSDRSFVRAVLNQCRATVLAMQEVRRVNPAARLVQTDDLGKTYSTPALDDIAGFYNERRWLSWDLLCGRVGPGHALHGYLREHGASDDELDWFRAHRCPPDVIGINYYITGERWLDERVDRYPAPYRGDFGPRPFADIEVSRALLQPLRGVGPLLREAWDRYRIPVAVTEAHIDANREDQLRWIAEIWRAARHARRQGVQVEAVTVWALLGSFDWNCLVTEARGYYEPGAFDVRSSPPRPTALAALMRELARDEEPSHPVESQGKGWWRRSAGRFLCQPVAHALPAQADGAHGSKATSPRPILLLGAGGTLGRAFSRICAERDLQAVALDRAALDICDEPAIHRAIERHRPWALINAGGFVRVDEAEAAEAACQRANAEGPAVLARACASHGLQMLSFSTDLVFDGRQTRPYVESDPVAPLNAYGRSKAAAEAAVLGACATALVVRTSAFFGPWDRYNFLALGLESLRRGEPVWAEDDVLVSPTYVPDLVNGCLELLIDGERGLWHLSNGDAVSWAGWLRQAAQRLDIPTDMLRSARRPDSRAAPRPRYSVLGSERGVLLPPLASALERFCRVLEDPRRATDCLPVAVRC